MGKVWEVIKNTIKWLWDNIKGFFYKDKREVNIERVFQQFQEDIVDKKEGELIVIGKNMRESPILWLGMFKKIVVNHVNFIGQIKDFFENENVKFGGMVQWVENNFTHKADGFRGGSPFDFHPANVACQYFCSKVLIPMIEEVIDEKNN